jgi:hypothetical protein
VGSESNQSECLGGGGRRRGRKEGRGGIEMAEELDADTRCDASTPFLQLVAWLPAR